MHNRELWDLMLSMFRWENGKVERVVKSPENWKKVQDLMGWRELCHSDYPPLCVLIFAETGKLVKFKEAPVQQLANISNRFTGQVRNAAS